MWDSHEGVAVGTPYERTNGLTEKVVAMGGNLSGRNAHASRTPFDFSFTRLTEPDDGPSRRCTACHPLALEAS